MLKRLGFLLLGTLGFVVAVWIIMLIPPGYGNWLFWCCLLGKMLLGLLILLKSFDFYRLSAFPPDAPALQDPIALWWCAKEQELYKQSKLAWLVAQFLFFFIPAFMLGFLLAVVIRPFYVSFRGQAQGGFKTELGRTVHFLVSSAVGLMFLTLSTLLGSAAGLGTVFYILYRATHAQT